MNRHARLIEAFQTIQEILMMREDSEITEATPFCEEEKQMLQNCVIENVRKATEE